MKLFSLLLFTFLGINLYAQKLNKQDKLSLQNITSHVTFLSDDKLEGRRTGTKGEELASDYIVEQFQKNGLTAKGDNGTFMQKFEINEGKQVLPSSFFILDEEHLKEGKDYFPFSWSINGGTEAVASPNLNESGNIWFWDLKDLLAENENNPHFDLMNAIRSKEKDAAKKGATALLIYNSGNKETMLKYDGKDRSALSAIPVVYLQKRIAAKLAADPSHSFDLKFKTEQGEKTRTGTNVVGYIDNAAATTVIVGAHFDHLGYGEDRNSRYTGSTPAIHNGADDNASGTAALIEISRLLKKNGSNAYNYLVIAFSGEELGLYGSKYYTEHPTVALSNVNFMVNMDMVGRFNDTARSVTIGGVGTSPSWGILLTEKKPVFTVKVDSSGTGPSDHTSFYRKDIPVLFFFTGLHTDYHTPSDDFDKINYVGELLIVKYITRLIERSSKEPKLAFTKTREQQTTTSARFTVSMGIMPDYTFSGGGVKVDGVSEGRAAQKAGIKTGDIVVKLGDFAITSMESYMQALSKFKKGDATKVKVKRGQEELEFDIAF
ncbi:MAG: M28 family peptidase [Lacibacter sp.]